jgi:hypothetical protein
VQKLSVNFSRNLKLIELNDLFQMKLGSGPHGNSEFDRKRFENVTSVSVQECGKSKTCIVFQGFDHMGPGEADCPTDNDDLGIKDLTESFHKEFPKGHVVVNSQPCETTKKNKQVGFMMRDESGIHELMASQLNGTWIFHELKMPDNTPNFTQALSQWQIEFKIQCVNLKTDRIVSFKNGGAKKLKMPKNKKATDLHVCFPTDDMYNNWQCYQAGQDGKPVLTHEQVNAD